VPHLPGVAPGPRPNLVRPPILPQLHGVVVGVSRTAPLARFPKVRLQTRERPLPHRQYQAASGQRHFPRQLHPQGDLAAENQVPQYRARLHRGAVPARRRRAPAGVQVQAPRASRKREVALLVRRVRMRG
jgi:hypothetical protein